MQILASALPGFRDLRAPLTAGYLWLILLWIAIRPDLSARPSNAIAASVYDLGKAAGPIWIGLGVSVAAYLTGCVSQAFSALLDRTTIYIAEKFKHFSILRADSSQDTTAESDTVAPRHIENIQLRKLYRQAILENRGYVYTQNKKERDKFFRDLRMRATETQRGLDVELTMPATLLIGKEPELFTEADRLKAESQLRFAVVPPLAVITIFLAISESPWWLLTGIALVVLIWQGYWRSHEFSTLMLGAVQRGKIQSQSIEEFEQWLVDLEATQREQLRTALSITPPTAISDET